MVNSIISAVYYFSRNSNYDSSLRQHLLKNKVEVDYETSLPLLLSKIIVLQPQLIIIDDSAFANGYNFLELFTIDSPFFVPTVIVLCNNAKLNRDTFPNILYIDKNNYTEQLGIICNNIINKKMLNKTRTYFPFTRFDEITTILRDFGINSKSSGSIFLKECINAVIMNNCQANTFNNGIYLMIATNHNTTIPNIERCIRAVVHTAWKIGEKNEKIAQRQSIFTNKPTVKELIFYISNYLRDKEIENKFRTILNPELISNVNAQ